jgi:hypothetical protein
MAESLGFRSQKSGPWKQPQASSADLATSVAVPELLERSPGVASPLPIQPWSEASLAVVQPRQRYLDLEDLPCFEVVRDQFQSQGVVFNNAIALCPSNPAFPPRSGKNVLMGAPKNGLIEARFLYPMSVVSGFVTSSRRTVLSAYDADDRLIAEVELAEANLANSTSSLSPNTELYLTAKNIHRVIFYAFGGHLTVDDISFGD